MSEEEEEEDKEEEEEEVTTAREMPMPHLAGIGPCIEIEGKRRGLGFYPCAPK